MTNPVERHYRVLLASFGGSERGRTWRSRLGADHAPAVESLRVALTEGFAAPIDELDGEHLGELLRAQLPGRLGGRESWAPELPDLLEDFLTFAADEAGVARAWEWITAIGAHRGDFERALADDARPRFAGPRREPDRRPAAKLGRNEPCPCGSGRKYKNCCLRG
ncbi:MAG: SEC-C metal-binding domain-containing protein [Planctomycetota bacterium]